MTRDFVDKLKAIIDKNLDEHDSLIKDGRPINYIIYKMGLEIKDFVGEAYYEAERADLVSKNGVLEVSDELRSKTVQEKREGEKGVGLS